jgi:flagellar protein FlaJ
MKLPIKIKKYNKNRFYGKDVNIQILLGISLSFSTILFLFGFFGFIGIHIVGGGLISGMDFIVFGLLSAIGPIGFYNHLKAKKKQQIEDHLPDFLREISSSASSGMTVFDSITSAARGEYGKLTPEIQKMSAQLSWGISVNEALENFANRINTPSVKRIVVTINKALDIGGNTPAVFDAAAKEIDQTKLVEQQRRTEMSLYSIVIFISFFVFLAVILIIDNTIFEEFFKLQSKMVGATKIGNLQIAQSIDRNLLNNTFFLFVLVQSVGGGLLGGFMMDGKISSGVRFGFILVLISFFIFHFLFLNLCFNEKLPI